MAKNLKINIKNTQIAEAINLKGLKAKLSKPGAEQEDSQAVVSQEPVIAKELVKQKEDASKSSTAHAGDENSQRKIKAKSKSSFATPVAPVEQPIEMQAEPIKDSPALQLVKGPTLMPSIGESKVPKISKEIKVPKLEEVVKETTPSAIEQSAEVVMPPVEKVVAQDFVPPTSVVPEKSHVSSEKSSVNVKPEVKQEIPEIIKEDLSVAKVTEERIEKAVASAAPAPAAPTIKLGPTGKHVNDLLTAPKKVTPPPIAAKENTETRNSNFHRDDQRTGTARTERRFEQRFERPENREPREEKGERFERSERPERSEFRDMQSDRPNNYRDSRGERPDFREPRGERNSEFRQTVVDRGPRPDRGDNRPERSFAPRDGQQFQGPRPQGQWEGFRGPRSEGQGEGFRGPRPQGQGEGYRGPRPQGQGEGYRGPRPEGQGEGFRGPRPQGEGFRGPRPQGEGFRGPRPQGQGEGFRTGAPRPPGPGGGFNRRPPAPVAQIYTIEELAEIEERKKAALLKKKGKDEQAEAEANSKKGLKSKDGRENKFGAKGFDGRDRQGLRGVSNDGDEFSHWRKRKSKDRKAQEEEDTTIRPTQLKIRLPISIKDLAAEMKLKASQLLSKLFLQGMVITLNDLLDDDTVVQLLGQEFGCEITIDTSEEERIRITNQTIKQEVASSAPEQLVPRAPVVTFMGHVDHGKTSLIDAIRKSNRVSTEAGAITQHIGAFRCTTSVGDIAILDTPGHEAFSAMRARGASVTDIVVLVISGEEGMKPQTIEAIRQAREAQATIVVAINKCDKPNFNVETVYRQLAEQELLPEAWGGSTITVNCSAVTGEGIPELLEMVALQSEVLELKANLNTRARGTVIESEMHKGLGAIARILVQNGTLRHGDAVVFDYQWGKVKTMHDEYNNSIQEAGPSTPVAITGLAGLPKAGDEFVVVANEREAREIAEARLEGMKEKLALQKQAFSMEHLMQHASNIEKKVFNLILRTDVQGSLDALKTALSKIKSDKIKLEIISAGVGEVSESDVEMAATSKSVILGFHTRIESHAEEVIKEQGIQVKMHDIIYHAVDDIITLMTDKLDKIPEEHDRGLVEVRAVFKSSQVGIIAGCYVTEGSIIRSHSVRVIRDKEVVWKGSISSLKRVKEDVREVQKGFECGIVLNGFNEIKEGDQIQSYEVVYRTQTL